MANEIIPISQQINSVTASMRKRMAEKAAAANRAFTAGNLGPSYPLLSIMGKEFTFRLPDGRKSPHVTADGHKLNYIDVILVEASAQLSKAYYEKGFDPSEFTRPDCWSQDSVKPDPSAPNLQNDICATCKQNEFGSRVTPAGKKAKACADHRRMVVLLPHQVGAQTAQPMAMRIPQSSLKNLKAHAELLDNYGVDMKACITRMQFTDAAFPQLTFSYVSLLNEDQWDWISALAATSKVQGMLHTPDFENAVQTPMQETRGAVRGLTPLEPAPPPVGFDKLMGNVVEDDEDEIEEIVPAQEQKPNIIELPDGKLFDTTTGEYIDRAEPEAEPEPAVDPDVIALPDGKFFNTRTREYVDGPQLEAKIVEAPAVKAKPKPKSKPKIVEEVLEGKAETETKPQKNGNGGSVMPASDAMEAMLRDILPPGNK